MTYFKSLGEVTH